MWRILDQGREPLRRNLAQLAGCDPEEIAINRNATEALNTVIFGLHLEKEDEVIGTKTGLSEHDSGLETKIIKRWNHI
jgi:selenocysteine lyase/cysteine desulfurase